MENIRKHRHIKLVATEKKKELSGSRNKISYNESLVLKIILPTKMKKKAKSIDESANLCRSVDI